MKSVAMEVQLRRKNQLTLPEAITQRMHVEPGDRLVIEIDEENPGEMRLRPLLHSYAGILRGVYGAPEEAAEYLRQERSSWDE